MGLLGALLLLASLPLEEEALALSLHLDLCSYPSDFEQRRSNFLYKLQNNFLFLFPGSAWEAPLRADLLHPPRPFHVDPAAVPAPPPLESDPFDPMLSVRKP